MDSRAAGGGTDRPRGFFAAGLRDLIEYARHEAKLREPQKDGRPLRAHLEAAANRGVARAIEALQAPLFPEALGYLYDWFEELSAARGEGMTGPAALTYQSIEAWARLTDRHPAPHEVRALLALDVVTRYPKAGED